MTGRARPGGRDDRRLPSCRRPGRCSVPLRQWRPTFVAEALIWLNGGPAGRAAASEQRAALGAELGGRLVLAPAVLAGHGATLTVGKALPRATSPEAQRPVLIGTAVRWAAAGA